MNIQFTTAELIALIEFDPLFNGIEDTRSHGISLYGVNRERDLFANKLQAHLESHWPNVSPDLVTATQKVFGGPVDVALVTHPPTGEVLKPWLVKA